MPCLACVKRRRNSLEKGKKAACGGGGVRRGVRLRGKRGKDCWTSGPGPAKGKKPTSCPTTFRSCPGKRSAPPCPRRHITSSTFSTLPFWWPEWLSSGLGWAFDHVLSRSRPGSCWLKNCCYFCFCFCFSCFYSPSVLFWLLRLRALRWAASVVGLFPFSFFCYYFLL